jgi:uncharacterized protein YdhG (YjbR/CyaY superfamily)
LRQKTDLCNLRKPNQDSEIKLKLKKWKEDKTKLIHDRVKDVP